MGFREVNVVEVKEVLRGWLEGAGLRTVAERAGVDRKTARRYVAAAQAAGLQRDAGFAAVSDDVVAQVVSAVRPARPSGHGAAWDALEAHEEQIRAWVAGEGPDAKPLSVVKVQELLARRGGSWCRIGRCIGSRSSGAGSAPRRPRCGWPMASRVWSCRSTSATWAT